VDAQCIMANAILICGGCLCLRTNQHKYGLCINVPYKSVTFGCNFFSIKNRGYMLVRVSAVSYFNSAPFVYGLRHSGIRNSIELSLDYPAECARKLIDNAVDVGLIPVATIPLLSEYHLVSNYCIGSMGDVQTVVLLSQMPLQELTSIALDNQSRTSSQLVRVLAKHLWAKDLVWKDVSVSSYAQQVSPTEGLVAIGDKVFELLPYFKYSLDLSGEWHRLTGLPFVFAAWVANKQLPEIFIDGFNLALQHGINSIQHVAERYASCYYTPLQAANYLTHSISYPFTPDKRKAMELFLKMVKDL
jgi:chorismate dehydratase